MRFLFVCLFVCFACLRAKGSARAAAYNAAKMQPICVRGPNNNPCCPQKPGPAPGAKVLRARGP
jgi:hypothetical protein